MFDEVTRRERGAGAARRARFVLGSTVLQALVLGGAVATGAALGAKHVEERLVPVTFVPPAPAPPALTPEEEKPPGPAGTPMPAARPRPKPPEAKPPEVEPAPAPKLVQPRELPQALPPAPVEPPEPAPSPGAGDGIVGGAPGGGGGAPVPGPVGPLGAPGRVVEEAPEDAARRNLEVAQDAGCMQRSAAREAELERYPERAGTVIYVEFRVSASGALSDFRALTPDAGAPLRRAMWAAIQRCRWVPGTDAEGRPTSRTKKYGFRFR